MIEYGVVGTSWITEHFIEGARQTGKLHCGAVYSRSLGRAEEFAAAQAPQAELFDDLDAMAASERIQAVYVASPNSLHYEQSALFLRAGKHVICEKPLTTSEEKARELYALAKEKGVVFLEAITTMHMPEMKRLEEGIARLGKVSYIKLFYEHVSSKYNALAAGSLPNIFNPAFATGAIMDMGVYCVYPILHLFGEPDRVLAASAVTQSGVDGVTAAVFSYPDKLAVASASKIGTNRCWSEVQGDKGTLVFEDMSVFSNMKIIWRDGSEETLTGNTPHPRAMSFEADSFAEFILHPEKNRERYEYLAELSCRVCGMLLRVRQAAGVHFPCDDGR
ncbi:MAG: Gfo/Idh/MocA family oxidoreductase [Oscillospiraceae bacterium]|nr:Gfo/Idh/MocA family oxidoreductase [Oscillospiraceae bacterium]